MLKLDWGNIIRSRALWIGIACIVGLLVLFYLFTYVDACRTQRKTDKQLANINAHLGNIAEREKTIANLTTQQAVEKDQVKRETEEHLSDVGATEEAKKVTNAALSNLEAAKNTNVTNTSVEDLQRKLDALNK